MFRLNKSIINQ